MDPTKAILNRETTRFERLTPVQADYVRGGARYVNVMIDGMRTGLVDMDRLEWDILTGRIPVTYK